MKEIRIKVENDMSKQDEIEVIVKLREIFEAYPNNYLKSLFTMNFTQWVENQIKNDFPPDAYDHFCGFKCDDIKRKLEKSDCIIKECENRVKAVREQSAELVSNIKKLQIRYNELEREYETLLNETVDKEDKLQKEIGRFKHDMILLKAKLYDKITS